MKPFLKWVGGKGRQVGDIVSTILNSGNFDSYYEPFLGGGAVALEMMNVKPDAQYYLSDINNHLIHAWWLLHSRADGYQDMMFDLRTIDGEYLSLKTVEEQQRFYYSVRRDYNVDSCWDELRAASFIWLNRNCFQGMWRVNRQGEFNVPPRSHHTDRSRIDWNALDEASRVVTEVEPMMYAVDFTYWNPKPNSFVFCDPPYIREDGGRGFTSYTAGGFTLDDHRRLERWLKSLPCKYLLTIGGEERLVREIYGEPATSQKISCTFSAKNQGRRLRNEYIFTNF